MANDCNIISWPLSRPFTEIELYKSQLAEAIEKNSSDHQPIFAIMRHTTVYQNTREQDNAVTAIQKTMGMFENLFRNLGDVDNGFPKVIPLEELAEREQYNPGMMTQNLMMGTPDEVIRKLKSYEQAGVDEFVYLASYGLSQKEQKNSLLLFCNEVIPAFQT